MTFMFPNFKIFENVAQETFTKAHKNQANNLAID